jgi:hypothetical protein
MCETAGCSKFSLSMGPAGMGAWQGLSLKAGTKKLQTSHLQPRLVSEAVSDRLFALELLWHEPRPRTGATRLDHISCEQGPGYIQQG